MRGRAVGGLKVRQRVTDPPRVKIEQKAHTQGEAGFGISLANNPKGRSIERPNVVYNPL